MLWAPNSGMRVEWRMRREPLSGALDFASILFSIEHGGSRSRSILGDRRVSQPGFEGLGAYP